MLSCAFAPSGAESRTMEVKPTTHTGEQKAKSLWILKDAHLRLLRACLVQLELWVVRSLRFRPMEESASKQKRKKKLPLPHEPTARNPNTPFVGSSIP